MNRHLAIKTSSFSVVKLRNSPAQYSVMARVPRLESECFNHNLLDLDLIRASLAEVIFTIQRQKGVLDYFAPERWSSVEAEHCHEIAIKSGSPESMSGY